MNGGKFDFLQAKSIVFSVASNVYLSIEGSPDDLCIN
jgi:hypothetical protein